MKFGLFTGALRRRSRSFVDLYDQFVDYVVQAERLGFESVFLVEHHFTGLGDVGASLALLSHLAARTNTIRLGTAVAVLPWHVPTLLAEQAATVDVVSGGRLEFGVGRGYRPNEFHGFHIDPEEARSRYEETLEVVLKAWTSPERFSHDGRFWQFRDVVVEPRPVQVPHPPIWVAAGSEGSVKEAADRGYRLLLDAFAGVDAIGERVAWFRSACDSTGREYVPEHVALTRGLALVDTDDPDVRAAELARRIETIGELASSSQIPGTGRALTGADHAFFDQSLDSVEAAVVIGTPEECVARLTAFRDVGIEYVLFNDIWGGVERLELFAEKVMPALR